jgi:DHA1 family tetracycline resistance protein-like MFS transporter
VLVVDMIGFSIILPLLPFIGKRFGASPLELGLLVSIYSVAQLFGAPILGRLSDRFGRKPMLLLSIAGSTVGFVMLAFSTSLAMLFLARTIDGLTGGNITIAQAYVADVTTTEERGRALGFVGAAFGLGFIIGPALGGALSTVSFALPALVAAGLTVINLIMVAVLVPESLSAEIRNRLAKEPVGGFRATDLFEALRRPVVGPLLILTAATALAFGFVQGGFTIWAQAALNITPQLNAIALATVGVFAVLSQAVLVGLFTKRFPDGRIIAFGTAISAVTMLIWSQLHSLPSVLVMLAVQVPAVSVSQTVMRSALTKTVRRDEVGGILGLSTGLASIAGAPAPVVAGALIGGAGTWGPGALGGALMAAAAGLAFYTMRPITGAEKHTETEPLAADEATTGEGQS